MKTVAARCRFVAWQTSLAIAIHVARREPWPADLAQSAAERARDAAQLEPGVWS